MAGVMSFKEAKLLAEDPNSCVQIENMRRKVNLSYRYVQCAKKGVQEILDNELNLYSDSLEGAMIAYQKVRLCQKVGKIIECQPFVQFDVLLDIAVFRPYKGAYMRGVVNKIGNDHIGLLIHKQFNGSLRRPPDVDVKLGEEVAFSVWKVYQHGGLTAIRGDLDLDSVDFKASPEGNESLATQSSVDIVDSAVSNDEKTVKNNSNPAESSSGSSKKRKRKRTLSGAAELNLSVSSDVKLDPGLLSPSSEKKAKRRKKDKSATGNTGESEKKKKRKRSVSASDLDASVIASVLEEVVTPSEKKKKRHKKDKDNPGVSDISLLEEPKLNIVSAVMSDSSGLFASPAVVSSDNKTQLASDVKLSSPTPKKKQKKKEKGTPQVPSTPVTPLDLGLPETSLNESLMEASLSSAKKLKKKKKHKKGIDGELDTTLNDSISSISKSDVLGSDSGISDSTPQSLIGSTKKLKKKRKSKGGANVSLSSPVDT